MNAAKKVTTPTTIKEGSSRDRSSASTRPNTHITITKQSIILLPHGLFLLLLNKYIKKSNETADSTMGDTMSPLVYLRSAKLHTKSAIDTLSAILRTLANVVILVKLKCFVSLSLHRISITLFCFYCQRVVTFSSAHMCICQTPHLWGFVLSVQKASNSPKGRNHRRLENLACE